MQAVTHRLTLKVLGGGAADAPAARVSASADVVPQSQGAGAVSMHPELDGEFRNRIAWSDGFSGVTAQHELNIGGELREGEDIALDITTPSVRGGGWGAYADETRASFRYQQQGAGSLALGDGSVDLRARLLRSNFSGRGGELALGDATEVRMFYYRPTRGYGAEAGGAQLVQHFDESGELRLTALDSSELPGAFGLAAPGEQARSYSVYVELTPEDELQLTGEMASSSAKYAGSGDASRWTLRYRSAQVALGGEYIKASPAFYGSWSDEEFYRADFSWSPFEALRLWANQARSRDNLDGGLAEPARLRQRTQYGSSWELGENLSLRITRSEDQDRDVLLDEFDDRSNTMQYQLSSRWDDFKLTTSLEDTRDEDLLEATLGNTQRFRMYGTIDVSDKSQLTFDASREDRQEPGGLSLRQSQLGIGGEFETGAESFFKLDIRRNKSEASGSTTWFSGEWREVLPNKHEIDLRVQHSTGAFGDNTAAALDYSIPLRVEATWVDVRGAVGGRLYLAHAPDQGLASVLVELGSLEVVTAEDGSFSFSGVEPGDYELNVSRGALGVGLSADVSLPVAVSVVAGQTADVQIPVSVSCAVSGRVVLLAAGVADGEAAGMPLADVVIVLQGMDQTAYRLSSTAGRFVFSDLRPGTYTVLIRTEGLPKFHEVEAGSFEVELAPGETRRDIEFKVRPQKREIQITTEG